MRFLADAGISPRTVHFLSELGHKAVHIRTLGLVRATDAQLIDRARRDSSVLLTFDLDFGDILALGVMDTPSVIIFRLADKRLEVPYETNIPLGNVDSARAVRVSE